MLTNTHTITYIHKTLVCSQTHTQLLTYTTRVYSHTQLLTYTRQLYAH